MKKQNKILLINFLLLISFFSVFFFLPHFASAQQKPPAGTTAPVTTPGHTDSSALSLVQQLNPTGPDAFIAQAWKYVLALLNIVVVLGLIFIAFANILRINIETYQIKRMLPAIIIGVILANFSFLICRLFVDVAQILADYFLNGQPFPVTGPIILNIFGLGNLVATGATAGAVGSFWAVAALGVSAGSLGLGALIIILAILLVVVGPPVILLFILGFLLAARIYLIWFLVIISPIAFFGLSFPPLGKVWQMWWSWWVKWLILAPGAFLIIKIAVIVNQTPWPAGVTGGFAKWFFGIILFGLAIYMPYVVGGKIVSVWSNLWKNAAGYGVKGARYAGVAIGGGMTNIGNRNNNQWLKKYGNSLQRTSANANMIKELSMIPGGQVIADSLDSQSGRWKRERLEGGIGGFMSRATIGETERHKMLENDWSATMTNSTFTASSIKGFLGSGFQYTAMTEEQIRNNAPQINKATHDNQMAAKVIAGRRRMEHLMQTDPTNRTRDVYHGAFTTYGGAGADISAPITPADPDWLREGKENYQRGQRLVEPTIGLPTGGVVPPVGPPAGAGGGGAGGGAAGGGGGAAGGGAGGGVGGGGAGGPAGGGGLGGGGPAGGGGPGPGPAGGGAGGGGGGAGGGGGGGGGVPFAPNTPQATENQTQFTHLARSDMQTLARTLATQLNGARTVSTQLEIPTQLTGFLNKNFNHLNEGQKTNIVNNATTEINHLVKSNPESVTSDKIEQIISQPIQQVRLTAPTSAAPIIPTRPANPITSPRPAPAPTAPIPQVIQPTTPKTQTPPKNPKENK